MKLLELLIKAAGASGDLKALLIAAVEANPDLRPEAERWLAALEAEVTPENFAAVVAALPAELMEIGRGRLAPRQHPSDAI